jgi:hypothetical protein
LCCDKIALVRILGGFIHGEFDRIYRQGRITTDRSGIVPYIILDVSNCRAV